MTARGTCRFWVAYCALMSSVNSNVLMHVFDAISQCLRHLYAGLRAADFGGTSDPYIVMKMGDEEQRSEVIQKCLAPVWVNAFTFRGSTIDSVDSLHIDVFDKVTFL